VRGRRRLGTLTPVALGVTYWLRALGRRGEP
jgi:hypothetical protein